MTGFWLLPWLRGVKAYVYGFPLDDDGPHQGSGGGSHVGEITAPVNQFSVMTHYPDASFRAVARTGLDTLFAVAWADLDEGPLVLSVPDTEGRYYVIALFDMWSNVFASIGKRTTGTAAAHFLIAGPGWTGHAAPRRHRDVPVPDALRLGQRADAGGRARRVRGGDRAAEAVQADAAQRMGRAQEPAGRGAGDVAAGIDTTPPPRAACRRWTPARSSAGSRG